MPFYLCQETLDAIPHRGFSASMSFQFRAVSCRSDYKSDRHRPTKVPGSTTPSFIPYLIYLDMTLPYFIYLDMNLPYFIYLDMTLPLLHLFWI